uniref:Uncharacterized protein n=1 Tax=Clandestinovirus TaxID=2831644 RepID=A0A8F8PMN5_9VIRU|nr:hypothetical protein KOM_12_427 [Clandestinovirus]
MSKLDTTSIDATIRILEAIESGLSFDEVTGTGTASKFFPSEKLGNKWYNHLWNKFVSEKHRRAVLLLQAFNHSYAGMVSFFRPQDSLVVDDDVFWTVCHFIQNELNPLDFESISDNSSRMVDLAAAYRTEDYSPFHPVRLWNFMTNIEKHQFTQLVIRKIAAYALNVMSKYVATGMTKAATFEIGISPPSKFYYNPQLLKEGYFPLFDCTRKSIFLWVKVAPENLQVLPNQYTYTIPQGTLKFEHVGQTDGFEFANQTRLVYVNGNIVNTDE